MSQFNLPLRAVPRAELEVSGQRVIKDAEGDEVALVGFDEHAEEMARAINGYAALHAAVEKLVKGKGRFHAQQNYIDLFDVFYSLEKP